MNCNFLAPCLLLLTFSTLPRFCEQAFSLGGVDLTVQTTKSYKKNIDAVILEENDLKHCADPTINLKKKTSWKEIRRRVNQKKRNLISHFPVKEVRLDWLIYKNRQWNKSPACNSKSYNLIMRRSIVSK